MMPELVFLLPFRQKCSILWACKAMINRRKSIVKKYAVALRKIIGNHGTSNEKQSPVWKEGDWIEMDENDRETETGLGYTFTDEEVKIITTESTMDKTRYETNYEERKQRKEWLEFQALKS